MDSVTSSDERDWAKSKALEKNKRYGMHIYFINYLSALNGQPWTCTQANFTVGARGSLKKTQFEDRLCLLGVTTSKARDKLRVLTVSKALALPDIILKLFHVSILRSSSDISSIDHLVKQFTLYKGLGDVDMICVHVKLSGKTENGTKTACSSLVLS